MKKLLLLAICIFIVCFIVSLSTDENDYLKEYFTDEEIIFIKDNDITIDSLIPYMKYETFSLYHYYDYEKIRKEYDNYLVALNLFNDKNFYEPYVNCLKALDYSFNTILVNKHFYLEKDYIPDSLVNIKDYNVLFIERENEIMKLDQEAMNNYLNLYNDCLKNGYEIIIYSAYRSYEKQEYLYYVVNKQNDLYSAKPGHSEHQTGLAIDISDNTHGLTNYFSQTEVYNWLINNAYKYGFINRYQENKEKYTLYRFEPWHFRYVGTTLASYLKVNDLSLEEYILMNYEIIN